MVSKHPESSVSALNIPSNADPPPRTSSTQNQAILEYCQGQVFQYRKPDLSENVPGYLVILSRQHGREIAWVPEPLVPTHEIDAYMLVQNRPATSYQRVYISVDKINKRVRLTDAHALHICPPTRWRSSITIELCNRRRWEPLWFHSEDAEHDSMRIIHWLQQLMPIRE